MSDARSAVSPCGHIAEPLQVIRLSIDSVDAARRQFPGYRLTRLVGARLELDEKDVERLCDLLGVDLLRPVEGASKPFDHHLRHVIALYELSALFRNDGHAPYHHAIRPTGYDYHRDEVDPHGMELWQADYRAMPDVRQMMAASILWLYRAGKDTVWLRRVPCIWHALGSTRFILGGSCGSPLGLQARGAGRPAGAEKPRRRHRALIGRREK